MDRNWEQLFCEYFSLSNEHQTDASHDLSHFRRVAETAKQIAKYEKGYVDPLIILAAAYFHDVVSLPKNHPENCFSSRYSAVKAKDILENMSFPQEKIPPACRAIETHSFSAGLTPETIEAKIIQDADRMESLGALGVMRTFYVSGRLQRAPFDPEDMFAKNRPLNDKLFGLDHFYCKLFKLPSMLQTEGGRAIASKRIEFLHYFVNELEKDVLKGEGGALLLVWTCYKAGRQNQKIFHVHDPLAVERFLEPEKYVLDYMIQSSDKFPVFISALITQFEEDVGINQKRANALA